MADRPHMTPSFRDSDLFLEVRRWAREEAGIEWPDDDLLAVIGKVHATSPDDLPDAIGRVLLWCGAAERSGDDEALATVQLWRTLPPKLIQITVDADNRVCHRLNPSIEVVFDG